jgi:hypothetical protein
MTIIPEFENRIGETYGNYLIQIDPQTVTRSQRTITRIMDYPGYLPGIGTGIGLIRIIGSLFVGIIAGLGLALSTAVGFEYGIRGCKHVISRAIGECGRGFIELFPYMAWQSDKHDAENHNASVSTTAHGKYIYRCDDYLFDTLYSVTPLYTEDNRNPLIRQQQNAIARVAAAMDPQQAALIFRLLNRAANRAQAPQVAALRHIPEEPALIRPNFAISGHSAPAA